MNMTEAKWRMLERNDDILHTLWWYFVPGSTVTMPWPSGWTDIDDLGNQVLSDDPNDHWKPWLKSNVGIQGWDWDWKLNDNDLNSNSVLVRFRKGKKDAMLLFAMRWK